MWVNKKWNHRNSFKLLRHHHSSCERSHRLDIQVVRGRTSEMNLRCWIITQFIALHLSCIYSSMWKWSRPYEHVDLITASARLKTRILLWLCSGTNCHQLDFSGNPQHQLSVVFLWEATQSYISFLVESCHFAGRRVQQNFMCSPRMTLDTPGTTSFHHQLSGL